MLSPRRLRVAFYLGGVVATAAGLHTAIGGASALPSKGGLSPEAESELRFYSAFYVAYGLALINVAPRADSDAKAVRGLAAALFGAGLARAGGWAWVGKPHPLQQALLFLELAIPPAVVAAQERLQRSV